MPLLCGPEVHTNINDTGIPRETLYPGMSQMCDCMMGAADGDDGGNDSSLLYYQTANWAIITDYLPIYFCAVIFHRVASDTSFGDS